eukprot:m.17405 g.17405  ORF g.17405 m.17405 type:complete len:469 (+) comp8136_c0_seq1:47-1453(+)
MDTTADEKVEAVEEVEEKLLVADICERVGLLVKGLTQRELRYGVRAVRRLHELQRRLTLNSLRIAIKSLLEDSENLLSFVGEGGDVREEQYVSAAVVPFVSAFLQLLVALYFKREGNLDDAKEVISDLVKKDNIDRREASPILARAYFVYARVLELLGTPRDATLVLNKALRTQTLQQNTLSQVVIINCLLRIYVMGNLIDQADLLVSKVSFPENAPTTEMARYMYYLGYVKAIQLDYTDAQHNLLQSTRKAPTTAVGFQQHAHKLLVIVQMLLGEIPERSLFRTPSLERSLLPYYHLTKAVRSGDVTSYSAVVDNYKNKFIADRTFNLVVRLRQSVIKAGVRTICLSYSRISLHDLALKLGLDSAQDAEYVVAKAVRDGVIDATIDHENKSVTSNNVLDVYSTTAPQEAFHRRILFCLNTHKEAVKSMRYPPTLPTKAKPEHEELTDKVVEDLSDYEDDDDAGADGI